MASSTATVGSDAGPGGGPRPARMQPAPRSMTDRRVYVALLGLTSPLFGAVVVPSVWAHAADSPSLARWFASLAAAALVGHLVFACCARNDTFAAGQKVLMKVHGIALLALAGIAVFSSSAADTGRLTAVLLLGAVILLAEDDLDTARPRADALRGAQ